MRHLPLLLPTVLALSAAPAWAEGPVRVPSPKAVAISTVAAAQAGAPGASEDDAAGADSLARFDRDRPPLRLEEALEATRAGNPDLEAARARLVAGRQGILRAWSAYLPTATVSGSYTYNSAEAVLAFPNWAAGFEQGVDPQGNPTLVPREVVDLPIQQTTQLGARAQVNQALLAAPAIPFIQNSYDLAEISRLSLEQARRELLFGTAQAFYGALGLKEAVKIQRAQLELLEAHQRSAQANYEAGTAARIAVLRAGIDVSRAEQDLVRSLASYEKSLSALAVLMGRQDVEFEPVTPERGLGAVQVPDEPVEAALELRPDHAIARLNVDVRERAETAAWLSFLPVIGANWTWQYSDVEGFTGENTSWLAMVTASWTLFDGGSRIADLKEAGAAIREARANLDGLQDRVAKEVRDALLDLESAQANVEKAQEEVRLARANWEAVERAFEVGAASPLDVSDASTALRAAELAQVAEAVRVRVAEIALQRALGRMPAETAPAR